MNETAQSALSVQAALVLFTGRRRERRTGVEHSVEGQCGVEMRRQVGSIHLPWNHGSMVRVEGAVGRHRVAA